MENQNESKNSNLKYIIIIIVVAIVAGVGGSILGAKFFSSERKVIDKSVNDNNKTNNEKKVETVPKESNEYFEKLLEAYQYVPSNFEIDNIDNKFLIRFTANYYTMYDKTYSEKGSYKNDKWTIEVPKESVSKIIEKYFDIKNKVLNNNYSDEWYSIQFDNDNYIITTNPAGIDIPDEKITSIDYDENNVTVNYELTNPYTNEVVGNKIIKLKYEDSKFKVQSLNTSITSENW